MGAFKLNTIERQYAAEARDRAAVERLVRETGRRNRVRDSGRDFREVLRADMGADFNFQLGWRFGPRRFETLPIEGMTCACGKPAPIKVRGAWRCSVGCVCEDHLRTTLAQLRGAAA